MHIRRGVERLHFPYVCDPPPCAFRAQGDRDTSQGCVGEGDVPGVGGGCDEHIGAHCASGGTPHFLFCCVRHHGSAPVFEVAEPSWPPGAQMVR